MGAWGWRHLERWTHQRLELPVGALLCVTTGPTRGRPRHAHAVEMAREGVPLNVIQRQLGHANLGITSVYLQGIDNSEIHRHRPRATRTRPPRQRRPALTKLRRRAALADDLGVSDIVSATTPQAKLRPNRIAIWPIDDDRYGIDFTYHGATGYADAEFADTIIKNAGFRTTFRQELDQAWTVRIGPVPRTAMLETLQRFAF
jgi:integrase/recombinase XerD